jgi:hypothetical protein
MAATAALGPELDLAGLDASVEKARLLERAEGKKLKLKKR